MISVKLAQIPKYLQKSELFSSLRDGDPDESILVPNDCFKPNTEVNNLPTLQSLLSTIRYWGIKEIPNTAINYLLTTFDRILPILRPFDNDLRLYEVIEDIQNAVSKEHKGLIAAQHGQPDILRYLLQGGEQKAHDLFLMAARHGHVNCMQVVQNSGAILADRTLQKACEISCSLGHDQCLKYALDLGAVPIRACRRKAIKRGHLACVIRLHENGTNLHGKEALLAAARGRLACLEYILTKCTSRSEQMCEAAAEHGHLDCLALAHAMGCAVTARTLTTAARCSKLDCMQFAVQQGVTVGAEVIEAACEGGNLQCLQYSLELGCPLTEQCAINAARNGHQPILALLVEHHVVLSPAVCVAAAQAGQVECLTYLHEELGCTLDEQVLNAAARGGFVYCLKYVHDKVGAKVGTIATTAAAAAGGSVQCLRFLHENGCPWDHTAATEAAVLGKVQCLRYIHKHGGYVPADIGQGAHPIVERLVIQILMESWPSLPSK